MKRNYISIIWRKEWRDALRDRRTILSMIIIPVVVMPLLIFGLLGLMTKMMVKAGTEVHRVMIVGGEDSPEITGRLKQLSGLTVVPYAADFTNQISDKRLRAAVEIPPGFAASLTNGQPQTVRIYHYSGELKSSFAMQRLNGFFTELREQVIRERLRRLNLPETLIHPITITTPNVAPKARVAGNIIGSIIPYLIIILCMTGAMYPAMDLTAGEKERGTIETLLCSPVARTHIVLGKFLTVLTASLATTVLALCSMGVSALLARRALPNEVAHFLPKLSELNWASLVMVFVMILPVAVFLSASQMAIALFARSFKEAQSYISPLMIVIIMPAVIGMLPGMELNFKTALIPILNTSLVCKELLTGILPWGHLALIFGSSCAYAALALGAAVWLFNRETVLFRG